MSALLCYNCRPPKNKYLFVALRTSELVVRNCGEPIRCTACNRMHICRRGTRYDLDNDASRPLCRRIEMQSYATFLPNFSAPRCTAAGIAVASAAADAAAAAAAAIALAGGINWQRGGAGGGGGGGDWCPDVGTGAILCWYRDGRDSRRRMSSAVGPGSATRRRGPFGCSAASRPAGRVIKRADDTPIKRPARARRRRRPLRPGI